MDAGDRSSGAVHPWLTQVWQVCVIGEWRRMVFIGRNATALKMVATAAVTSPQHYLQWSCRSASPYSWDTLHGSLTRSQIPPSSMWIISHRKHIFSVPLGGWSGSWNTFVFAHHLTVQPFFKKAIDFYKKTRTYPSNHPSLFVFFSEVENVFLSQNKKNFPFFFLEVFLLQVLI